VANEGRWLISNSHGFNFASTNISTPKMQKHLLLLIDESAASAGVSLSLALSLLLLVLSFLLGSLFLSPAVLHPTPEPPATGASLPSPPSRFWLTPRLASALP
jgi:hypothetical protein